MTNKDEWKKAYYESGSNKNYWIILIIVIIALASVVGFWLISEQQSLSESLKICEKEERQMSKNECYNELASARKDPTICEKIGCDAVEEVLKDICPDTKNICYTKVAREQQNLKTCDILTNQTYRYLCYNAVINRIQDLKTCDRMANQDIEEDYDTRGICYAYVAQAKKDSTICEEITNLTSKDSCYFLVVLVNPDINICKKIEDPDKKDGCYVNVALAIKDFDICEDIVNQSIKDSCHEYAANYQRLVSP